MISCVRLQVLHAEMYVEIFGEVWGHVRDEGLRLVQQAVIVDWFVQLHSVQACVSAYVSVPASVICLSGNCKAGSGP